jgi:hypothetical protein
MAPSTVTVVAAWASLLTAAKSLWELSRMVKRKLAERDVERKARSVFYNLREANRYGLLSNTDYSHWMREYKLAKARGDCKFYHPGRMRQPQ